MNIKFFGLFFMVIFCQLSFSGDRDEHTEYFKDEFKRMEDELVSESWKETYDHAKGLLKEYLKEKRQEALPLIPESVQQEISDGVIEQLRTMKPEEYEALRQKVSQAEFKGAFEEFQERLKSDPEFRKKVIEQLSCVLYQTFKTLNWKSSAENTQMVAGQQYRERLEIAKIPALYAPLNQPINKLINRMQHCYFNKDGVIRIASQDNTELEGTNAVALESMMFLQRLFPNDAGRIVGALNIQQIKATMENVKDPNWLQHIANFEKEGILEKYRILEKRNQVDNIGQQYTANTTLISKAMKAEESQRIKAENTRLEKRLHVKLEQYKNDPYFNVSKNLRADERLKNLQARNTTLNEIISRWNLTNLSHPALQKIMWTLVDFEQSKKSASDIQKLFNGLAILSADHKDLEVVDAYKKLFDSTGICKILTDLTQITPHSVGLPASLETEKYADLRSNINTLLYLQSQEKDVFLKELIKSALEKAIYLSHKNVEEYKKYELHFGKLINGAIKNNRATVIAEVQKLNAQDNKNQSQPKKKK